nr:basic leucine zipper transcriptional factor ATF-like isoform X2 [Peromyscus maniculatus bairdii]
MMSQRLDMMTAIKHLKGQVKGHTPIILAIRRLRQADLCVCGQLGLPSQFQESEDLEKQNAALRKEIKQLTEELKYFTSVLSSHEPLCSVLASGAPSPPEVVYSAHPFHQPHISSPRFQP